MNRQIKFITPHIHFIAPHRPNDQLSILKIIDRYQARHQPKLVIVRKLLPLHLIEFGHFDIMPSILALFLFLIEYISVQSLVFLVKQLSQLLVICFNRIWFRVNELHLLTTCLLVGGNLLYLLRQVRPYVLGCDYVILDE